MIKRFYPLFPALLVLIATMGSLRAQPLVSASISTPANAGVMAEDCGTYSLVFTRIESNQASTEIFLSATGLAQIGVDFDFPAGSFPLTMDVGEDVAEVEITVIADGSSEGFENITFEIAATAGADSDVVFVETGIVDAYSVTIDFPADTLVWCRYEPFALTATSDGQIQWSPAAAFTPSSGPSVTLRPINSGWHYATVGADDCVATDSIYVDVAVAEIIPDTAYICLGDEGYIIPGQLFGPATDFTWIPSDATLANPNLLNPTATPTVTTTYILQSDIGVCIARDTIVVRVDSLPQDLHIDIAPLKSYYCAGEVVALFSPTYDSLQFPDIQFQWTPDNDTYLTEETLLNIAIELQDTTLYIREVSQNACVSQDSILINVVPSGVPLSVTDTILCPGEQFQVFVLHNDVREPEWTPEEGLSCTNCLDPVVTVLGTPGMTIVYEFSGMVLDCPVGATLAIQIPPAQPIGLAADQVVCAGDVVPITITNPEGLSGFNWTILGGNGSLSCTNCPDPSVTVNAASVINILVTADTNDPNFCGAQGFIQLTPGQQAQVNGPSIQACRGETATASTGDPALTNISWDVISGDLDLSCTQCPNPAVTINGTGLLRFFADSPDPDICRVVGTVSATIFAGDESNILLTPNPADTEIPQGSEVMGMLAVNEAPPTNIVWTLNGNILPGNTELVTFPAENELNFLEVTFTNSKGCEQTDTISFATVPPSYQVPNAFTPNGDNTNDNFRIILMGNIQQESFVVYNRWGQKVYEARDGDTSGWDGMFKGERASSDTYVYTAELRFPDGRRERVSGDVILIR